MNVRILASLVWLAALLPIAAASAQDPTSHSPDIDVLPDAVIVYRDGGPAWWKVTKGDSAVFILGLPLTYVPYGLEWDRRTLQRRLKGARLVLAPNNETGGVEAAAFLKGAPRKKTAPLSPDMSRRVIEAANRLGGRMSPRETVRVDDLFGLRGRYIGFHNLNATPWKPIFEEVHRAGVPVVTPPLYQHIWTAKAGSSEDPNAEACYDQILKDSETPLAAIRLSAEAWAVGDVEKAIAAAPSAIAYNCRGFWPGIWERTIGFQTQAIAQSLEKPGKVIVVTFTPYIVVRNGILDQLRAQGFTVADPAKPLTD